MNELRMPPTNEQMERFVLGASLISTTAAEKALRKVTQSDLTTGANRAAYAAISALHSRGAKIDCATVAEEMRRRNWLERIGGPNYLYELASGVEAAAHVDDYAQFVVDAAMCREMIRISGELEKAAYSLNDPMVTINKTCDALQALERRIDTWDLISAAVAHADQQEELETNKKPLLFKLGIEDLDQVLYLHPGDLIILSGQTNIGKSATALHWLTSAAIGGAPSLMVTLEMSRRQCEDRVLASYSGLPLSKIAFRSLDADEKARARECNEILRVMPLHYAEKSGGSVESLCAKIRDAKREHNLEIVVIDQLNRLMPQAKLENERREIDYCVRRLKDTAMVLGIVVILLVQLKRSENDQPMMEDLRGSGAIAQDSDAVLLAHRPGRKKAKTSKQEEEDDSLLEWVCDKQRNGPPGWRRQRIFRKSTQEIYTLQQYAEAGNQLGEEESGGEKKWPGVDY